MALFLLQVDNLQLGQSFQCNVVCENQRHRKTTNFQQFVFSMGELQIHRSQGKVYDERMLFLNQVVFYE
ncbi:hypothetical protein WH7805_02802 [Synechococcus sp. WH 7805]|nr:hypothetical protein WH7805_02802 [Synechococcus sp. WH 7805]